MAGGEGRAGSVDEPVGRTGAIDQCLENGGEQRRQALGDGESGEAEPAASAQEEQCDEGEPEGTAEPAPEPVEREREVSEQRSLDVMHCVGPTAVHAERSRRYEDGDQDDEREHSAGCPKSMSRLREKRPSCVSRWPGATGWVPEGRLHLHIRYMCAKADIQNSISAISSARSQSITTSPRSWDACD